MYATVMRQAFFVLFEQEAHAAILGNASPERLNELYMANLREQFGDSGGDQPGISARVGFHPHIYNTPFYCYAYSFGQLLVLALYRRYQQEGDAFKPGYLKLLAYGGSAHPEQILREAGVDIDVIGEMMTDPAFWQGGFDVIGEMIDAATAVGGGAAPPAWGDIGRTVRVASICHFAVSAARLLGTGDFPNYSPTAVILQSTTDRRILTQSCGALPSHWGAGRSWS
jgi:hypothetical protein